MTDRINQVEKVDRIMEQLADSVLELSDEAILAETAESGANPQEEAERTRLVLRQAAKPPEVVDGNQRIAKQHFGRTTR
jgi:acyl-CoA reductase-like NAD-dependent aldehyde dehydrogenase